MPIWHVCITRAAHCDDGADDGDDESDDDDDEYEAPDKGYDDDGET